MGVETEVLMRITNCSSLSFIDLQYKPAKRDERHF